MDSAIKYALPNRWIKYDPVAIVNELSEAKAQVMALRAIPFQKRWVEELQKIQLKMEVAGTSQIEGADFAGNELDQAVRAQTPEELITRSQKQANAAARTYQWISSIPDDRPVTERLIEEIHRGIVTGCDDDHCPPGQMRGADQNVTFGFPKHRGVSGGPECMSAVAQLVKEVQTTFRNHDPLIQALALHYHFAAMHPFIDGNGRTARAIEALMLQRAGLRNDIFIAMSNFYYEEKQTYLATLSGVRAADHDLTSFLKFGLRGIAIQSGRLTQLIRRAVSKQLFRNLMHDLYVRLESTRKRVIVQRQLAVLERLLSLDEDISFAELQQKMRDIYKSRKQPTLALARDVVRLNDLGAVSIEPTAARGGTIIRVNLEWPMQITDSEFFSRLEKLPKSKTHSFLASAE